MRELVVVLSDVYLPPDTDAAVASRGGHARYAAAESLPRSWRDWLAARVGRSDLAGWPVAALAAAAEPASQLGLLPAGPPAFRNDVMLATPLHLVAGLDHVRLPSDGLLALSAEELEGIASSFEQQLGQQRGLSMRALGSGTLLVSGLPLGEVLTEDPARWLGGDLREALPRGAHAGAVRALSGELEMWLHQHPVNVLRQRRGLAPVSTLWLWGGGMPPRTATPLSPRSAGERSVRLALLTRDPAAYALRRLARLPEAAAAERAEMAPTAEEMLGSSERTGIAVLALSDYGQRGLLAFEQEWLLPARAALAAGRLEALRLMANDRVVTLMRFDALKLWRPARHWLRALS